MSNQFYLKNFGLVLLAVSFGAFPGTAHAGFQWVAPSAPAAAPNASSEAPTPQAETVSPVISSAPEPMAPMSADTPPTSMAPMAPMAPMANVSSSVPLSTQVAPSAPPMALAPIAEPQPLAPAAAPAPQLPSVETMNPDPAPVAAPIAMMPPPPAPPVQAPLPPEPQAPVVIDGTSSPKSDLPPAVIIQGQNGANAVPPDSKTSDATVPVSGGELVPLSSSSQQTVAVTPPPVDPRIENDVNVKEQASLQPAPAPTPATVPPMPMAQAPQAMDDEPAVVLSSAKPAPESQYAPEQTAPLTPPAAPAALPVASEEPMIKPAPAPAPAQTFAGQNTGGDVAVLSSSMTKASVAPDSAPVAAPMTAPMTAALSPAPDNSATTAAQQEAQIEAGMEPAAVEPPPTLTPMPVPASLQAPAPQVVKGFANHVPLAVALRQILPQGYGFTVDQNVDLGVLVSFRGGKPWHETLDEALAPAGLVAHDQGSQMVEISTPSERLAPTKVSASASDVVTLSSAAKPAAASAPAEAMPLVMPAAPPAATPMAPPTDSNLSYTPASAVPVAALPSWDAEPGDSLHKVLENWAHRANVEFDWIAEYDYPIQASIHFNGKFEDAVRDLLTGFETAHPQPIAELHANSKVGQMVLVVTTRGNTAD